MSDLRVWRSGYAEPMRGEFATQAIRQLIRGLRAGGFTGQIAAFSPISVGSVQYLINRNIDLNIDEAGEKTVAITTPEGKPCKCHERQR